MKVSPKYGQLGGTWLYPMKDEKTGDDLVSIGFVVDLNYRDATTSAHDLLQTFKLHPLVKGILDGGERVGLGRQGAARRRLLVDAQALDAGRACSSATPAGWSTPPRSRACTTASSPGILAAEAIYQSLKGGDAAGELRAGGRGVLGRPGALPGAQHPPGVPEGLHQGQPAGRPVDHVQGQGPARPPAVAPRRRRSRMFIGDTRDALSQARRQVHVRQALERLHLGQRDP